MKKVFTVLTVLAGLLLTLPKGYAEKGEVLVISNPKKSDPEVVATLSDRDAIPLAFRSERMYCYVADNHKVYQLRGGVTNAHWVELDIASSMKIQGPAGSLPYIDATGLLATDLRYLGKAKFDFSGANLLGSGQYISVNGIGNTVNDRSHNNINAYNSYSDGNYVMIIGERDSALGEYGVIMGKDITLNANQQFAAGRGLTGQTAGEVIFGQFNDFSGGTTNLWQASDRLFTIGNGTSVSNRSNAMVIYKNGDAVFGGNISAANMYTKLQIDSMFVVNGSGTGTGTIQNLNLAGSQLTITGGNTVNFSGWDTDASDDFSGDYNDLINQPAIFSGDYADLTNKPSFAGWDTDASDDFSGDYNDLINQPAIFSGDYADLTNKPSFAGWDTDASDDFSGDFNDLTNTPNFSGWDQNAADDFSGDYNDLVNKPALFSGSYNDLTNKPTFAGWDTDASDDFSGDYNDLSNQPDIYLRNQVDSAIAAGLTGAGIQNLNLSGTQLSISGGNTINFNGWDTDASDDFDGDYNSLSNLPKLFTGNYNDLSNKPDFTGWDQNAADDFSGNYSDLTNTPDFTGWDTDASDDFSGNFNDLYNVPIIFSGNYKDLYNRPNFSSWDTIAADDFSGDYNDLINKPALFSGDYADLTNKPTFTGWDTDASDDFSGDYSDLTNAPDFSGWDQNAADDFSGDYNDLLNQPALFSGDYNDLTNKPTVYTKVQVDSLFVVNGSGSGSGTIQNLNLAGSQLTITGGNTVNFAGWDTDASDDFSGDYNDLINTPKLFNGDYNALTNKPTFTGWDTDASDDFSGDYGDLVNIPADFQDGVISWNEVNSKPQLYTRNQVDSIKQNIVDSMKVYVDSAVIAQGASELISNRNLVIGDVGKTLYVKSATSVLSIPTGSNLPFNAHIELRDFGSGTLILDASAVTLRNSSGDVITSGTHNILIQDAAITAIGGNEYKIIGLYQ